MLSEEDRQKIAKYLKINNDWERYFRLWYGAHYALGCVALFLSTLVAAKPYPDKIPYDVLSWLLAFCTGLLTFLAPQARGNQYRRAWTLLTSVITQYEVDGHTMPEDVMRAHQRGENIIHNEPTETASAGSGSSDAEPGTRKTRVRAARAGRTGDSS
jgi:hypothetical protein